MTQSRACVFVDGENLRYSLVELFDGEFDQRDYLPEKAEWAHFFDLVPNTYAQARRIRTYWYVVGELDFSPRTNWQNKNPRGTLSRYKPYREEIKKAATRPDKEKVIQRLIKKTLDEEKVMLKRFAGWKRVQDGIIHRSRAVEFRRAGSIRYDLIKRQFGSEKAVDVQLAVDLIRYKDIYDVAIIVSGDQDYVPAIQTVKDYGKTVINVAFEGRNGRLLPGGARRLNLKCDHTVNLGYDTVRRFMNFPNPSPGQKGKSAPTTSPKPGSSIKPVPKK